MALIPTDPLYGSQWHFSFIGDIERIWDDVTGVGVNVGIYDDGVQYTHHDLDDNYNADLHITIGGSGADPMPVDGPHGTSVAGLIAAENNGSGAVGVAFGAAIAGVNIFSGPASSGAGFLQGLDQLDTFDVTNSSWGYSQEFQSYSTITEAAARFEAALVAGRGGLGTISVKAAGNNGTNANAEIIDASRSTVTVSAYDDTGDVAWYSNHGANLLISAPSSGGHERQVTTDLVGPDGYSSGDWTSGGSDGFGGTSGATPIISGVVALMLDANPGLGWRDIHNILAYSATEVGSGVGGARAGDENDDWLYNAARNWNGGGLHFSGDYGFGSVNAFNAVRMAEAWSLFESARSSANEHVSTLQSSGPTALSDSSTTNVTFDFASRPFELEYVEATVDITHSYLPDLRIELTSPGGTTSTLFDRDGDPYLADSGWTWTFGANAFRGEDAGSGTWTLRIADMAAFDSGTLNAASLRFYGRDSAREADLTADVYHYTDEISQTLIRDPSRMALADADGGDDWLNMAAMSGAVDVDMSPGGASLLRSTSVPFITIAGDTSIENAISGDGNDRIQGNEAVNNIYGARGDDHLLGHGGDDKLVGASGDDLLDGGRGDDRLYGEAGGDVLVGGSGADRLDGQEGDDDLGGGDGEDKLIGASGNDTLAGGGGNDRLYGEDDDDVARGDAGADRIAGQAGDDVLEGGEDDDRLIGGDGHDTLNGEGGEDRLYGDAGDDQLAGGSSKDYLFGGEGDDSLDGGEADDWLYGGPGDDWLLASAGTDKLFGDESVDVAVFNGNAVDFDVTFFTDYVRVIDGYGADGDLGTTYLTEIETVQFNDGAVPLPGAGSFDLSATDYLWA